MGKPATSSRRRKFALVRERARGRNDITLVIDPKKVVESARKILTETKDRTKKKLTEAGITLTVDQDKALDEALGIVDGGLLDQAIDKATGVDDMDDETAEDDDAMMGEDDVEEDDGLESDGGTDDESDEDDDDDEHAPAAPTKEALKGMNESQLRAALSRQIGATERYRKKARENRRIAERATTLRSTSLREQRAQAVLAEMNIPETFRGRLMHELTREPLSEGQMKRHVADFDKAFIRPALEGAGLPGRSSGSSTGNINLTFEPVEA